MTARLSGQLEDGCNRVRKMALGTLNFRDVGVFFFIAFILLKPMYIFPSGSLQIGDVMIIMSFICMLVYEGLSFLVDRNDLLLLGFIGTVILIDAIYACIYQSLEFIKYASYYVFNGIAVLLFRRLLSNRSLLATLVIAWRFTLLIQVFLYFSNLGSWYDSSRYMGSFNDPNQLGFFVLSTFILIKVASYKQGMKQFYFDDIAAVLLIFETGSTGMLLGIVLYYLGRAVCYMRNGGAYRWQAVFLSISLLICFLLFISQAGSMTIVTGNSAVDSMASRVTQKLGKLGVGDSYSDSIIIDRGLDKLFLYPQMILYGAGEGEFVRFTLASASNELHSTVFGLIFYYGVIPFCMLIIWAVHNFRRGGVSMETLMLYMPPLVECLTLANQRQPAFWLLLTLASLPVDTSAAPKQTNVRK